MRGYAGSLPLVFTAEQLADLRGAARAVQACALELSTAKGIGAVARSFVDFCAAMRVPLAFRAGIIQMWLVDYCRQGWCARALDGRLSALRRFARSRRMSFPAFGSYDWDDIKDTVRACLKVEPTEEARATVVDLHWLRRVAAVVGVSCAADLETCHLRHLQLLCRAYVCHAAMLRGVEHRFGLRTSDVRQFKGDGGEFFRLAVATRYSEKKKKLCPGRQCVLPVEPGQLRSAGTVLKVYRRRMGLCRAGGSNALLFPLVEEDGRVRWDEAPDDGVFIRGFIRCLRIAGMSDTELAKVSNHSFRAGGATDWSVGGLSEMEIAEQGGWTSRALRRYIRPQGHHAHGRAVRMRAAIPVALGAGGAARELPTAA